MAETITHELALHGSDLDKIIKTYEKNGIEAVKKLFASDPEGDMDHESLAKQDKKHVGVSNYNQVKKELINLKSASNLNGNLNCSKELEHYSS